LVQSRERCREANRPVALHDFFTAGQLEPLPGDVQLAQEIVIAERQGIVPSLLLPGVGCHVAEFHRGKWPTAREPTTVRRSRATPRIESPAQARNRIELEQVREGGQLADGPLVSDIGQIAVALVSSLW